MSPIQFEEAQNRINQSRLAHALKNHAQDLNQNLLTNGGLTNPMPERELQNEIIRALNEKRILFFHGSTAHKTKRTEGEPDFVIALPEGRTLWVECKTRTGKLSEAQTIVRHRLETAGHAYHVVRNISEFDVLIE